MARDREVTTTLEKEGWLVLRFWERQIKKELSECVNMVLCAVEEKKTNCTP